VKRRFLAACMLLFAMAVCSAASAAIVPQHSIAGVTLGMTEAKVKAKLGAPTHIRAGTNDFGNWRQLVYKHVTVTFQSGKKATALTTRSVKERTAKGVGVGSTRAALRKRVRGLTCKKELGLDHCWAGRWQAGRVVTDFRLAKGRVTQVTIAYVLD
jgi:hypothetical protein